MDERRRRGSRREEGALIEAMTNQTIALDESLRRQSPVREIQQAILGVLARGRIVFAPAFPQQDLMRTRAFICRSGTHASVRPDSLAILCHFLTESDASPEAGDFYCREGFADELRRLIEGAEPGFWCLAAAAFAAQCERCRDAVLACDKRLMRWVLALIASGVHVPEALALVGALVRFAMSDSDLRMCSLIIDRAVRADARTRRGERGSCT